VTNKCPSCGTVYPPDARFCTRDGTRLLGGETPRHTEALARVPDGPDPQTQLSGRVLDRRYRIERKLGEGGTAFVYLGVDIGTGERFAIKVLSSILSHDANAMARLRREASVGMRLTHPNICSILRMGETEDGVVYVVMPFVEGEILAERTQRLGTIPLATTVSLVNDMATGLQVAHDLRIVHRDLKPENVMVATRNGVDRAVVMDFGFAKERRAGAELQKLTATGIILGTPEFMSPEQLRGKSLDARTDIYSLALMTCEMLTGKLPFSGRTQQEMMIARLRSAPTPTRQLNPAVVLPEAIDGVIDKALQRNPDDRYASAPEFARALADAAAGASPPPASARSGGFMGRLFGG
jgi:serine/threonine-protein kinase